jgi:hypothetical protein
MYIELNNPWKFYMKRKYIIIFLFLVTMRNVHGIDIFASDLYAL